MSAMNVINKVFKTHWGIGRWLRLGIGIAFLFDAYYKQSEMVAFFGLFLVYQGLWDTGCGLGNDSCAPTKRTTKDLPDISHNFIQLNKRN